MDWCQIVFSRWQEIEGNRNSIRSTNQVQALPEELFSFGGTIIAVRFAAHFFATTGSHPFANGQGQTIYDEHLPIRKVS